MSVPESSSSHLQGVVGGSTRSIPNAWSRGPPKIAASGNGRNSVPLVHSPDQEVPPQSANEKESMSSQENTIVEFMQGTILRLKGCEVIVSLKAGNTVSGILSDVRDGNLSVRDRGETITIPAEGYSRVELSSKGDELRTDDQIGGKLSIEQRSLQRWNDSDTSGYSAGSPMSLNDEISQHKGHTSWDQFKHNRDKFGVESTYSHDIYTTGLDRTSDVYQKNIGKAKQIERDILHSSSRSIHEADERGQNIVNPEVDEEALYSSVANVQISSAMESDQNIESKSLLPDKEELKRDHSAFSSIVERRIRSGSFTKHRPRQGIPPRDFSSVSEVTGVNASSSKETEKSGSITSGSQVSPPSLVEVLKQKRQTALSTADFVPRSRIAPVNPTPVTSIYASVPQTAIPFVPQHVPIAVPTTGDMHMASYVSSSFGSGFPSHSNISNPYPTVPVVSGGYIAPVPGMASMPALSSSFQHPSFYPQVSSIASVPMSTAQYGPSVGLPMTFQNPYTSFSGLR